MNISQLRYFQHLARVGHFTKAAAELNLTQSALSSCIRRIEAELGCSLFVKSGRNAMLSDAGQVLLRHADLILNEYDATIYDLQQLGATSQKELNLATTSVQYHQLMTADFSAQHPDIIIRQQIIKINEIPAKIADPTIDLIISSYPYKAENVACARIFSETLLLAIPRDHPLADRTSVTLEDVKDLSFISLPVGYAYRDQMDLIFSRAGYRMNVVFESFPEQFPRLVTKKIGAVLATESSIVVGDYPSSIKTIPFSDASFQRDLYILWRKNRRLNEAAQKFFDFVTGKEPGPAPDSR